MNAFAKTLACTMLSFTLAFGLCPAMVTPAYADSNETGLLPAVDQNTVLASGSCGSSAKWNLYASGKLAITGSGSTTDYAAAGASPLAPYTSQITSITIGSSITSIGNNLFAGCNLVSSVSVPSSVKTIGAGAFQQCGGLQSIGLPSSLTSIGAVAFKDCYALSSVTIPGAVTSVGVSAFENCSHLSSVSIPNSVTSLGASAFANCKSLSNITIPNRLTSLSDSLFKGCSNLGNMTIPSTVTSIGSKVFYGCQGITEVNVPANVTSVGAQAFANCPNMLTINFGSKVPTIGDGAFTDDMVMAYYNGTPASWANVTASQYGGTVTWISKVAGSGDTSIALSKVTIGSIASQLYTGNAICPEPSITYNGKALVKGTDFSLSYKNNVNVGTATVTVTGKGTYTGSTTIEFAIVAPTLNNATIAAIPSATYTGSAITPTPQVTLGGNTLVKDTDYTLTYSNNTNAGTATVTVTGKGSYSGTTSATFTISRKSLSNTNIASVADQAYTGSAITPSPAVTVNGKTLVKNTDYTLSYSNNTASGTATVTATGKGNYTGTAKATFSIYCNVTYIGGADGTKTEKYVGTLVLPTPAKAGYNFEGWYTNSAFTGSPVTTLTNSNTTVYAKWSNNTHTIRKGDCPGGTVTLIAGELTQGNPTLYPKAGDVVYFRTTPDAGYTLTRMSYTTVTSGRTIALQRIEGTGKAGTNSVYSFIMPDEDVILNATFGENIRPIAKNVTAGNNMMMCDKNGNLITGDQAINMMVQVDSMVYFKALPAKGWKLSRCNITYGTSTVACTSYGNGVYGFKMPNYNVTLNATFVQA